MHWLIRSRKGMELMMSCLTNESVLWDIRYNYTLNYFYDLLNIFIIIRNKMIFTSFIYDNEDFLTINRCQNIRWENVSFIYGFNMLNGSGAIWLYLPWNKTTVMTHHTQVTWHKKFLRPDKLHSPVYQNISDWGC